MFQQTVFGDVERTQKALKTLRMMLAAYAEKESAQE